jgi:hypothetical protein
MRAHIVRLVGAAQLLAVQQARVQHVRAARPSQCGMPGDLHERAHEAGPYLRVVQYRGDRQAAHRGEARHELACIEPPVVQAASGL